jgi:hypothetical protein
MLYDTIKFIQSIRSKYWLGMLAAMDAALIGAARGSGAPARPSHPGSDVEFMRFLAAARTYLLGDGEQRPAGLDDEQFALLRPLCEGLVKQGRFAPSTLDLFAGLDPLPLPPPQESDITERKDRR